MEKIKVTYGTIMQAFVGIMVLLNSDNISYKTGLKLNKNVEAIKVLIEDYQKEEKKLVDKYFKKDENGQPIPSENGGYELIPETVEEYKADRNTLDTFEVEMTVYKIDVKEIGDVKIKPSLIPSLAFMVNFED